MGESLTEQRRVKEEVIRDVNFCYEGRTADGGNAMCVTVLHEEATAYRSLAPVFHRRPALPPAPSLRPMIPDNARHLRITAAAGT